MFGYNDFIQTVNKIGIIATSYDGIGNDFPKTRDYAINNKWYSDDSDTDPTSWVMRAVSEKKVVYGSYVMGKKVALSPELFNLYYEAFHPDVSVEERNEAGLLGQYEWKLWQALTEMKHSLGTHELRRLLGVTPKSGASSLDTATVRMIMSCDIVVVGESDMLDKKGIPYNKSIAYDKLENWIPVEWRTISKPHNPTEAVQVFLETVSKLTNLSFEASKKYFNKQIKMLK